MFVVAACPASSFPASVLVTSIICSSSFPISPLGLYLRMCFSSILSTPSTDVAPAFSVLGRLVLLFRVSSRGGLVFCCFELSSLSCVGTTGVLALWLLRVLVGTSSFGRGWALWAAPLAGGSANSVFYCQVEA